MLDEDKVKVCVLSHLLSVTTEKVLYKNSLYFRKLTDILKPLQKDLQHYFYQDNFTYTGGAVLALPGSANNQVSVVRC